MYQLPTLRQRKNQTSRLFHRNPVRVALSFIYAILRLLYLANTKKRKVAASPKPKETGSILLLFLPDAASQLFLSLASKAKGRSQKTKSHETTEQGVIQEGEAVLPPFIQDALPEPDLSSEAFFLARSK